MSLADGLERTIAWTRANESLPNRRDERTGVGAEIGEGWRVVIRDRVCRALAGCSATTILFGRMFNAVYVLYDRYKFPVLGMEVLGLVWGGRRFLSLGVNSMLLFAYAENPSCRFYESLGATPMNEWTVYRLTGEPLQRLVDEARPGGG